MDIRVGTSGYQYKFWKGTLYDAACKEAEMLSAYSRVFPTVEINNTFYRMPKRDVLANWASQVPDGFRFAIKAPQRITHIQRLVPTDDSIDYLFENLKALGEKLGVVLFQLPPFLRADLDRLRTFFAHVPPVSARPRIAFEFRHDSWQDDSVYAFLREQGASLCTADIEEGDIPVVATSEIGYVRLRREVYTDTELASWASRLREQPWREVYVFFKHEEDAPALAQRFRMSCGEAVPPIANAPPKPAGAVSVAAPKPRKAKPARTESKVAKAVKPASSPKKSAEVSSAKPKGKPRTT